MLMKNPYTRSRDNLLKLVGSAEQLASINRFIFAEGKAKGVEAIRVETGAGFDCTLLVDRALDLGEVRFRGRSLCWRSPAGVVAPAYYERAGLGWLRGFGGGMMVTCGLRNVGTDSVEGWESFGLHGEISYAPATRVSANACWKGDRYLIEASGEVREAYLGGPHFVLRRTWRTELGASWIELEDAVTNEGYKPEIHMQLYHWNFGFPLFNPASELYLTSDVVRPRDKAAAEGIERWRLGEEPDTGAAGQVFYHRTQSNGWERAVMTADGEAQDWGVELSWEAASLPYLTQWKMCGAGEYVCGIEPGNCLVEGREWSRARGLAPLAPGETRRYRLRLAALEGSEAVISAVEKCRPADAVVRESLPE
jgi:hypothetical protein